MGRTADRIARLEAQLTALDAAVEAFAGGVEEYTIGPVTYRRSRVESLHGERRRVEADLSMLRALQDCGGQSFAQRGAP